MTFPQIHSIDIGSKQAVNDQQFARASVLTELVRRAQHIRGLQWRTHGGEGKFAISGHACRMVGKSPRFIATIPGRRYRFQPTFTEDAAEAQGAGC